jgi:site-specific recombinase XerD
MIKDLRQLHAEFMEYSEFTRNVSPDTLRGYKASFELLMKKYPDLTPGTIDADVMTEFFRWLQRRERIVGRGIVQKGVKKSTIATYWRKLSKFFGWLQIKGGIRSNPLRSDEMEFPTVRYDDRKYLGRKEMEKILAAIAFHIPWKNNLVKTRNLAIVSLASNCGMRRGEMLSLKVLDVNLGRLQITVLGETSKSKRTRIVPLNSRAKRDLESYLLERRMRRYMTEYLWVSENYDGRLTSDGLRHVLAYISRESGVKFHFHQFRHTFAVNFLHNSGLNAYKLQDLLGHRTITSTATYTRCLPIETVRGEVERLGSLENTL